MRCEFDDGLRVSYSGKLRITKGNEINVFLEPEDIPANLQGELHAAARHESCGELRTVAQEVTEVIGTNLPEEWQ